LAIYQRQRNNTGVARRPRAAARDPVRSARRIQKYYTPVPPYVLTAPRAHSYTDKADSWRRIVAVTAGETFSGRIVSQLLAGSVGAGSTPSKSQYSPAEDFRRRGKYG